jgi:putative ABC transport system substrate-binding protein
VRRREFIALLGGAAAAPCASWPLAALAQQPAVPVIGYFSARSPDSEAPIRVPFLKALEESGFVAGRNVAIEYRFAEGRDERLPLLAADLVSQRVAMLVATDRPSAMAAKAATATIPIVFTSGLDPVQIGLVASFNRPGGNITGISLMNVDLAAKRLGLLHELLPRATRFAVLANPTNTITEPMIKDLQAAASGVRRQIEVLSATTNGDIDAAFASVVQQRADALLVNPDGLFFSRRVQIVTLAVRYAVPAIYFDRVFTEAGGLMSYGANLADLHRWLGIYTGRILKGEKPADLPIVRAAKFEFVINLQTAKTLGAEIPATLLARADEVIE